MSLSRSISGGVNVGAMFGMVGAAASLIASGGTLAIIVPTLAAGTFIGAGVGGMLGASGYMMANAIPGLRHTLGMPRETPYVSSRGKLSYDIPKGASLHQEEMEQLHHNVFVPDHIRDMRDEWQERIEAEREASNDQRMR